MSSQKQFLTFLVALAMLVSALSAGIVMSVDESGDEIFLARVDGNKEIQSLKDTGFKVMDHYGSYAIIKGNSYNLNAGRNNGLEIQSIPKRTTLNVKGHEFDFKETGPRLQSDMKINGYPNGVKGMYIVHTLGPVNPEWRETIEDMGAEVMNYVPNYAYNIRMTPKLRKDVESLDFVDHVDLYHPGYKLAKDVEPGKVTIKMVPGTSRTSLEELTTIIDLESVTFTQTGNKIIADAEDTSTLEDIAHIEDVYYISQYDEPHLMSEVGTQIIGGGCWVMDDDSDPSTPYRANGNYGAYANQIGYDGTGVVTAIADTGLGDGTTPNAGHNDFTSRVVGGHDFGGTSWFDGHGHGTHCAGLMAGDTYDGNGVQYAGHGPYYVGQGLASDSDVYAVRIFDGSGSWVGPSDYYLILEVAKQNADAYVHSNSWGSDSAGAYGDADESYDIAVRDADSSAGGNQPMVLSIAASNAGPGDQTTGSPGNAKNVMTIGASQSYMPDATSYGNVDSDVSNPDQIADFSSRGWTEDNRIKPTLAAPGEGTLSTHSPDAGDNLYGLYSEDNRYEWCSGTSQACPTASGAMAVVVDYYESTYGVRPSPAMVKALMVNSAYDMDESSGNTPPIPNRDEGWGLINLVPIVDSPVSVKVEDQNSLLTTGNTDTFDIQYDSNTEPLKISLTWTDKNALSGDNPTLKNNLDLEVVAPDGTTVYKGNAFDSDGDSVSDSGFTYAGTDAMSDFDSDGNGYDDRNVVENVFIPTADLQTGSYTVRVIGDNIPADANNDGSANQDYALVMYNAATVTSDGSVTLDKDKYALEDTATITLTDLDLAGSGTHDVTIDSDTETSGETVTLTETATEGQFTGTIDLSATDSNGVLQVSDADTVTVYYDDADIGDGTSATKTDTATVDGSPPTISSVTSVTKLAARVEWTTDEASNSTVNYGLTTSLGNTKTDNSFVTSHSVPADNLIPGQTYYYEVVSTDEAGNTVVDDNGGSYYTFTPSTLDDVEAGNVGWTAGSNWQVWGTNVYGGSFSWNAGNGDYGTTVDSKLTSPVIDTSQWTSANWTWYHSYDFEDGWDGGVVEVNDGSGWTRVTPSGGYDGALSTGYDNVLEGQDTFTGDSSGWVQETVSLDSYLGTGTIQVRYWMGTDSYDTTDAGWNVDNIEISGTGSSNPPSITVTDPNGGEVWTAGTDHAITWSTTAGDGTITGVDLEYSSDGGSSWNTIVSGTADDGTYTWTVPNDPSTNCLVRATVHDDQPASGSDTSDATFEIATGTPPSITVTDPNGGEVWDAGTDHAITWSTTAGDGTITGVDLEYSSDGGGSWNTIVTGTADDGSYTWTVPDDDSTNCLVRATVHDDQPASGNDTSDAVFEIVGIPPAAPGSLTVEHYGVSSQELVTNGIFDTDYSPWTLNRAQTDGTSAWDGTETNSADGSGSVHSSLSVSGRNTVYAEEGVWTQTFTGTSTQLTVNGAYKATINNVQGNINYNRATIEIDVYDTGTGSWQNIYSTGQLTTSAAWTNFGPDATYTPSGQVNEVRVRLLTEISTAGGGTIPTADCDAWADDISVYTSGSGGSTDDNAVNWTASADDGAGDNDVDHYVVYRSDVQSGPWNSAHQITTVTADGSAEYSYIDSGRGTADSTLWWYVVRAVDADGLNDTNTASVQEPGAPSMDIPLYTGGSSDGWNFVSFNLTVSDTSLTAILDDSTNGIAGNYDKVMYFDSSTGEWRSYMPGRADQYDDLSTWDHKMGLWIRMTADDTLTIEGTEPTSTDITLQPGWNMVGYPSDTATVGDVPVEVTIVGYFDGAQQYNLAYNYDPSTFNFEPGKGYWLYNSAGTSVTWTVNF